MENNKRNKTIPMEIRDYAVITVSCVLYAMGVSLFLDPNSLAPGGMTGVSILLSRITGWETGTLLWLLNIPILLLGIWKFGVRFLISTLYCIALTSLLINYFSGYEPLTEDPLVAVLAGSAALAVSVGWIMKAGATTGGTDIIVKVLRIRFPHFRTGTLFLLIDFGVVAASWAVLGEMDRAVYAALCVGLFSVILDMVLYGRDGAKMIYIISDEPRKITARLLEELNVGVTYISGNGAYSQKKKDIIFCVMRKALAPGAETIVREEDPEAFMIVSGASEIYGRGYKNIFSEKL